MIIINANINQEPDFENETEIIEKVQAAGIDNYISVNDVSDFLHSLIVNQYQQIILITNFSPDIHFKYCGIDVRKYQIEPSEYRIRKYEFSSDLYQYICRKYPIFEVHFITSALDRVRNELYNVTGGIYTTVQDKRVWLERGDYHEYLKRYILTQAFEAVNSLLIPSRQKLLLKEIMRNYCQN